MGIIDETKSIGTKIILAIKFEEMKRNLPN